MFSIHLSGQNCNVIQPACWWRLLWLVCATLVPVCARAEVLVLQGGAEMSGHSHALSDGMLVWELPDGERVRVPLDLIVRVAYERNGGQPSSKASAAPSPPFVPPPPAPPLPDAKADDTESQDPAAESKANTKQEKKATSTESDDGKPNNETQDDDPAGPKDTGDYEKMAADQQDGTSGSALLTPYEVFVDTWDYGWERVSGWTKRLEFGGRFLDGNSDDDFLDIKGEFEHETEDRLVQLEFGGEFGESNGVRQTNRWYGDSNVDFSKEGKWILFVTSKNEYDEFENLDYRGTLSGGLGYRFYNEKRRRLIARLGPAVTHEFYRDPERHGATADVFAELETRWPVRKRARFENKVTLRPSVDDFEVFRLTSDSGLLFHLDARDRWKLKLGFDVDFNSEPNRNREPTDYTTTISLVYRRK